MVALSSHEVELLIIVGVALAAILGNRLRPDLVALLVLLALGISGILTPEQAVAGFSRSAVLTIVGLFVITATLEQTGVVLKQVDRGQEKAKPLDGHQPEDEGQCRGLGQPAQESPAEGWRRLGRRWP